MKQWKVLQYVSTVLLICLVPLIAVSLRAQNYADDTTAVRTILNSNGLFSLPVDSVVDSAGGRIVTLRLSYRKLFTLPPEIGNLTGLTRLDISSNDIAYLPDETGNLALLKFLNIADNRLRTLPDAICLPSVPLKCAPVICPVYLNVGRAEFCFLSDTVRTWINERSLDPLISDYDSITPKHCDQI